MLFACSLPLPTNDQTTPPSTEDFVPIDGAQPRVNPFAGDTLEDVPTTTKFKPDLSFDLDSLKASSEPAVTISIYQTKGELEIRQTQTIIEQATFHFDKLQVGQSIGNGKMDIGTPPKLTLDVDMKVTATDGRSFAQASVKGSHPLVSVYIADLQVKTIGGGLSIISIGNATRANDDNGVATTIASARVTQTLSPGFVKLPDTAGPMRTRTIVLSEPDPETAMEGRKVFRPNFTIE